jgi:hypothetical protein
MLKYLIFYSYMYYIEYNEQCILQIFGTIIHKYSIYYLDIYHIQQNEQSILQVSGSLQRLLAI